MRNRFTYAGFGVLATLFGVAFGHLVAAVTNPSASPVLAVGSQVIDLTPTPMKEWAIEQFGTHDKLILLGSVMVGVLIFAAVAGLLTLRRFVYGAAMFIVLVAVAAYAALNRPTAGVSDALPAVASALAGIGALWLLDRTRRRRTAAAPVTPAQQAHPEEATAPGATRRGVLVTAAVLAAAAAVMGGAGRWISTYRTRISDITLPAATDAGPALPQGIEGQYPGITPFRSSNSSFYRVDTRLDLPIVDVDSWTLTIDGMVDKELVLTFDDLMKMDLIERDITLTCVSNDVGGLYVGGASWLGVRLTDLLDQAGVDPKADQLFSTDVDGMTISTPIALAADGRDAMIAIGMNGEPLPREHGFPARMVVPGLYGFISATKWVSRITVTTYAEDEAYWTERKWDTDAPIKMSSRIDTPQALQTIDAGDTFIGGIAWAQDSGGVAKVEVRIDGGAWQEAMLGPDGGNVYWRQWYLPWSADSGQHFLAVRCTAGDGDVQTSARASTFPGGSSGIQEIAVIVS